ncbi:FAST kinase domain-containing protein 2, mitochondrial [Parambassis ranga]|uniref:FAST kinase domain-containing protein 2, mitochondrial n=1 Tax=Parambassis ranga TaxID=210632 RepID=A0A6P7HRZ2_9TELE|nr:FAST kinase domain-containing protein 2, mitochondrial [Parambassis ranga]
MSARVTEEVMRCGLRFCSRRSLWQQRSILKTASIKNTFCQQLVPILAPAQSHTSFSWDHVRSVRFYSQGRNRTELEEKEQLSSLLADVQHETSPELIQMKSPFFNLLQRCGSPSDVLDLTCQYSPTNRQVSSCLNHMWTTTKKMSEEQRRYELQLMFEHPAFDSLLQRAMKVVKHMRLDNVAYSLLSMVNLGVPQQSRVVQTFLRICQEKLNEFDEKSLSILASCLGQMESSPNVEGLKDGMRVIVEARLPGIKSVIAFQTMMRVVGKDAPKDLKAKLEKKALSMTDQFSLPNTQYMITTMATTGFYSKPLLDVCSKKIAENLHGVPFSRLFRLLLCCKELLYRDLDLFNAISDYVVSTLDIWTNKQLLLFLFMFQSLAFCPASLMEAVAEKVIANPNILTRKDLLCVLKVYSSLNYDLQDRRQQFLDSLSHAVHSYLPKMSAFDLLKCVYCLCLLGHFPSAPLQQLLQSSVLDQLAASKSSKIREGMFQMVDLCLRLDRPPLPQQLSVPATVLGDPTAVSLPVNPCLSQSLQKVLGDKAQWNLQEMLVVENVYVIDGVITKTQLNQEASSAAGEEVSPAESSQRIAVLYTLPSAFCFGTTTPRGALAVKIRHLKILGYTPVLVMEQEMQLLSEKRRTDALREQIFPEHHMSEPRTEKEGLGL